MTHVEIEPWAAKTLLYLRSSSENCLEEMRTMLMEAISQKYNGRKQYKTIPPLAGPTIESSDRNKFKDSKSSSSEHKSKSHSSGGFSPSIPVGSPDSYGSDSDFSSDTSEMVILEDEIVCTICKDMACTPWNQVVECSECHSIYHQQCHIPPIPDSDVRDPRNVWYCRNCTKTVSKPKASAPSGSSSHSSKNSSSSSSSSSGKIATGRSNTASPSFGSKPFGGVSSSSSSNKKSSSSKSSHSSSNKVTPTINMVSADKRLQIMKKKAARNKQDKRQK